MKAFRFISLIFLAVSVCFLLAIPVLGFGSTAINWKGICYGFTDGQTPCSWWEFAQNEMFWTSMLVVPLLAMTLATWLIVTIIRWTVTRTNSTQTK
ncbi:MAG: hypothetical protein DPW18_10045 [Chloroflexi bacterium]|nr:hypothetical protein [Chloroflexota bacterium]MDL1943319.1 hypothetical protein [Chloroflexi bacterium CFX2]